jgi:exopolysaccharide production protein ExoQ
MTEVPAGHRDTPSRRAIVLGAVGVLAPLVCFADPLAIAPLFAIAAVAILALDRGALKGALWPLAPFAVIALGLAAWATVSALWSVIPLHSFLEGLRLILEFAGGWVLLAAAGTIAPSERRIVTLCAAAGLVAATAFGLHEALTGSAITRAELNLPFVPLTRFDRSATTLALALWPVLAACDGRRIYAGIALALCVAAAVWLFASTTALLAVLAGLAVLALSWRWARGTAVALAACLLLFAAAAPFAVPSYGTTVALHHEAPWLKWSGLHRLLIWRFTSDRIMERPLLGWGMDASRAIPGGEQRFADLFPNDDLPGDATALPLHPHDAALEWEVELGVPGTVLALGLVLWGIWRIAAADISRLARASALAWVAAALVIGLLAYGIWQAWWVSTLFLTASLLSAAAGETSRESAGIPARGRS